MSQELVKHGTIAARFLQVANETQATELGKLLKFAKGHYQIGDDEVTGHTCLAHVDKMMRGWVKFGDGKVADQRVGKVADGFEVPKRDELGDLDQDQWERDAAGKPRDPWALQYYLPVEDMDTGDVAVFVTSSRGGIGAIGQLCDTFAKNVRNGLPIIKLGVSSYKHKAYGRIEVPDFQIVSWSKTEADADAVNIDAAALADGPVDQIPF
jgi:hypothetical protein